MCCNSVTILAQAILAPAFCFSARAFGHGVGDMSPILGPLWRYVGAFGIMWGLQRSNLPEGLANLHVELLLAMWATLLPLLFGGDQQE